MTSNEGLDPHPKDDAPRDYLTATAFEAAFEAAQRENRLILQGIQATLNRIVAALNLPQAQGNSQQPPVLAVRNNPMFRRAPQVAYRKATLDDSKPSDKEVEDIIVRRLACGNDRGEYIERKFRSNATSDQVIEVQPTTVSEVIQNSKEVEEINTPVLKDREGESKVIPDIIESVLTESMSIPESVTPTMQEIEAIVVAELPDELFIVKEIVLSQKKPTFDVPEKIAIIYVGVEKKCMLEEYGRHMVRVARQLFEALATNLAFDPMQKVSYLSDSDGLLRVYRYPCCPVTTGEVFGMDAHTDSSVLSILNQDEVGGLQVLRDLKWVDVRPIPGTLVVNLGDMMQAMSNDEYKSVKHRVVVNGRRERLSICYFGFPMEDGAIHSSKYKTFTYKEFRAKVQEDIKTTGFKVGLDRFKLKEPDSGLRA
uniref:GA2ox8 n=1 Tax=Liriodendron chinense TaxID=3414 RepID=A0A977LKR1_LIRCH|nr:GA2ox8 [Liriodendron chinense]